MESQRGMNRRVFKEPKSASSSSEQLSELPLYTSSGPQKKSFSVGNKILWLVGFVRQILEGSESRNIFFYLLINLGFMLVEMVYGVLTNSLGLISDGFHMLFDSTALMIGLYASVISKWKPNPVFSYGYARFEILSGFVNGVFLVLIAFFVLIESLERFLEPPEIETEMLLFVSTMGLVVNLIGVFAFSHAHAHGHGDDDQHGHSHGGHGHSHKKKKDKHDSHDHGHSHKKDKHLERGTSHNHSHSHKKKKEQGFVNKVKKIVSKMMSGPSENMSGIWLHVLADTLGSVGVIISSCLIMWFGWTIADPICSFCLSLMIFLSVLPLISSSGGTLIHRIPSNMETEIAEISHKITTTQSVKAIKKLNVFKQSKDGVVITLHVHVDNEADEQAMRKLIASYFTSAKHLLIQIEKDQFYDTISGPGAYDVMGSPSYAV
eukprot:TRINITY_DN2678_c0_g1_i1.p1 TRINITY_DN2678_c0_g1~~TRINITY_DN2678_c0_g1_i1.p1  ORF type:complete len:434 (-),score=42.71 TRINITY_DN2678_c0_g1_i1:342-1643(-)